MKRCLAALLLPSLLALAGGAQADTCEAIRAGIEARIAASGVTRFAVETVDAAATVEGQVVGRCEMGGKKIVYRREAVPAGSPASPSAPVSRTPRGGEALLTECRDGTVSVGGDCKQ